MMVIVENAAIIIQSHSWRVIEHKKYLKIKSAVACIQSYTCAWLIAKQRMKHGTISTAVIQEKNDLSRKIAFMIDRHNFVRVKCATTKIQLSWKKFLASDLRKSRNSAAIGLQSHLRGNLARRRFLNQKQAAIVIQSIVRSLRPLKDLQRYRDETKAAIVIQSHLRGWIVRRNVCHYKCCVLVQSHCRRWLAQREFIHHKKSAIVIQSHLRGWIVRRNVCYHKSCVLIQSHCRCWLAQREFIRQKESSVKVQSAFRGMICRKYFNSYKRAAIEIQRFARGSIARRRLLGSSLRSSVPRFTIDTSSNDLYSSELMKVLPAIVKLQRWWRRISIVRLSKAAVIIQSYIRGYMCQQKSTLKGQHARVIQAHWRGYVARKDAKEQLHDLRSRMQKSAANVNDGMRIINRLIVALKELKSMKNVSGILHNCATLDTATKHSRRCCETLVDEGAIDILLYQIRSATRSIPDQEVLKHCLSTLGNLARYPDFADMLVDHQRSVETIFWELLRNKEDGFFIACDLLKKLCMRPRGTEAICNQPSMLKRLHALVEELNRKANHEKRNHRGLSARDAIERRSREASQLLNLVTRC